MSSALDIFAADFPHGTREGFARGCKSSQCPGEELGLSCRAAAMRYAGDYSFRKRVDAGMSVVEILTLEAEEEAARAQTVAAARRAERVAGVVKPVPAAVTKAKRPTAMTPEQRAAKRVAVQEQRKAGRAEGLARKRREQEAMTAQQREERVRVREAKAAERQAMMADRKAERAVVRAAQSAALREERAAMSAAQREQARLAKAEARMLANEVKQAQRAERVALAVPRASKPITHGTNAGYVRGCRCEPCVMGHRTYHREYWARRRAEAQAKIADVYHGTAYGYQLGCRSRASCPCDPSCADVSLGEERRRRREQGIPEQTPKVPARPVLDHIAALRAAGMPLLTIVSTSGVSRTFVSTLVYGRADYRNGTKGPRHGEVPKTIDREKAEKLLALEIPNAATSGRSVRPPR